MSTESCTKQNVRPWSERTRRRHTAATANTKLFWIYYLSTIDDGLVHTLDCRRHRWHDYHLSENELAMHSSSRWYVTRIIQRERLLPFVSDFFPQKALLGFVQHVQALECCLISIIVSWERWTSYLLDFEQRWLLSSSHPIDVSNLTVNNKWSADVPLHFYDSAPFSSAKVSTFLINSSRGMPRRGFANLALALLKYFPSNDNSVMNY